MGVRGLLGALSGDCHPHGITPVAGVVLTQGKAMLGCLGDYAVVWPNRVTSHFLEKLEAKAERGRSML